MHRAVPLLRDIGQALGEQLLELGARAAPQQQRHAPVMLSLPAAGIGAARWPRAGPAPAPPGSGRFDPGRERDGECVPAAHRYAACWREAGWLRGKHMRLPGGLGLRR